MLIVIVLTIAALGGFIAGWDSGARYGWMQAIIAIEQRVSARKARKAREVR